VGVGRDLCGSPSPTPCPSRVTQSRLHSPASRRVWNISREPAHLPFPSPAASPCPCLSRTPQDSSRSEHRRGAFAIEEVSRPSFPPVPLRCSDWQPDRCRRPSRTRHAPRCRSSSAPWESPYSLARERSRNSSPPFPALTSHQQNLGGIRRATGAAQGISTSWACRDAARLLTGSLLSGPLVPGCSPSPRPKPQPLTKAAQRDLEIAEDSPRWE